MFRCEVVVQHYPTEKRLTAAMHSAWSRSEIVASHSEEWRDVDPQSGLRTAETCSHVQSLVFTVVSSSGDLIERTPSTTIQRSCSGVGEGKAEQLRSML